MTTIQLTEMLGWLSIINIGILLVSTLALVTLKSKVIAANANTISAKNKTITLKVRANLYFL